jgi:thioredoxin reductase (NADPH)
LLNKSEAVVEVAGAGVVQSIRIKNNKDKTESEIDIDGFFLAIGHIPVTGFLENKLALNEAGYVVIEGDSEVVTNIPGVFVAGEIQDHEYKQAITTAAAGCKAALEAQRYLEGEIKGTW